MSKAATVLKALEAGIKVKIGDDIYAMDDRHDVCFVMKSFKIEGEIEKENGEVLVKTEMPVSFFVTMCNAMVEDDFAIVVGNLVLNK